MARACEIVLSSKLAARIAKGVPGWSLLRSVHEEIRDARAKPPLAPLSRDGAACADVMVYNARGLHARAAARLESLAKRFEADIRIARGDNEVDARSIMGLMMLSAGAGTELQVHGVGRDAVEGVAAIVDLIECGFHEID